LVVVAEKGHPLAHRQRLREASTRRATGRIRKLSLHAKPGGAGLFRQALSANRRPKAPACTANYCNYQVMLNNMPSSSAVAETPMSVMEASEPKWNVTLPSSFVMP